MQGTELDVQKIRQSFPIFENNPQLSYLDSTATALKPQSVITAMTGYYNSYSANVFRGVYPISEKATAEYEAARLMVAKTLNAQTKEIIFVRNTTEALNLVAYSLGRKIIDEKAEIVVSMAEHHSNFVPWQQLCLETGATFKVVDVDERGLVPLDDIHEVEKVINVRTKIVALFHISNVLGTINPLKKIIANIKKVNPKTIVIVDGAQSIPSLDIDVVDMGCDFFAFSGHKVMGPTGIGVLWGKQELLEDMYPFLYGGEMISKVSLTKTEFSALPNKFEAGTPHIAGAIGLNAALKFRQQFASKDILEHERVLWTMAYSELKRNKQITIVGPEEVKNRTGILAFYHHKIHAHDLGQIMAEGGVCVRAGHHCAMPLHESYKVPATVRASFYIYNNQADVTKFLKALERAEKLLL